MKRKHKRWTESVKARVWYELVVCLIAIIQIMTNECVRCPNENSCFSLINHRILKFKVFSISNQDFEVCFWWIDINFGIGDGLYEIIGLLDIKKPFVKMWLLDKSLCFGDDYITWDRTMLFIIGSSLGFNKMLYQMTYRQHGRSSEHPMEGFLDIWYIGKEIGGNCAINKCSFYFCKVW